jgi:hypothetical protein
MQSEVHQHPVDSPLMRKLTTVKNRYMHAHNRTKSW